MAAYIVCFLLFTVSLVSAPAPARTKVYRSDYTYNKKTDAFYKLHIETRTERSATQVCSVEGAQLMIPSQRDIIQLHGMLKQFPDIGNYVWVGSDGKEHESAEETPIIDLSPTNADIRTGFPWSRECDVVTRQGDVDSFPCYRQLPFICKVEAKDAPYDEHCHVFGTGYKYFPSIGSCYKIPRIVYSWNEAYADCRAQNAHLLVLNSETEMLAVKNLTNTELSVAGARFAWFFYAGFRADKPVGNSTRVFKTIFNQTLEEAGYSVWSPNEPNNALSNEDCGSVFKNDGKLNDVDCSQTYAFVCEKEINV
uniref:Immunlectin A n=1 Tax=Antheraea pernyi TaxID=7119 RepID=H9AA74_ANTPE|nr:immunlectin A [Antheraea pernyi]